MAISFVTTTSYGSWLPGDLRGYVRRGVILPGDPELLEMSRGLLKGAPVRFSVADRERLFHSLVAACEEFGYRLSDVTIESWHLHLIVVHGDDKIETVMGRLKTRMRQAVRAGGFGPRGIVPNRCLMRRRLRKFRSTLRGTTDCGCRMGDWWRGVGGVGDGKWRLVASRRLVVQWLLGWNAHYPRQSRGLTGVCGCDACWQPPALPGVCT